MLVKFKTLGARDAEEGADGGAAGPRPRPLAHAANARTAAKIATAVGLLSHGAAGCPFPHLCKGDDDCAPYFPSGCGTYASCSGGMCLFQVSKDKIDEAVDCPETMYDGSDECTYRPAGGKYYFWFDDIIDFGDGTTVCSYIWCPADTTDAGGPYFGLVGSPVEFGGSAPSDPDGHALTYTWDFRDGNSGTGERISHTYAEAGGHWVRLKVTNGDGGASGAAVAKVTVKADNKDPVAVITGGGDVVGAPITFDGSGSSDPDGDPLTYEWFFDDGSKPGTGQITTHTYAKAGTYRVELAVSDGYGGADTAIASVTVS